ncbi:MAG: virulence factor [Gaiellales bacterium]
MPELTVIYWRDIPAQVTVGAGRGAARAMLSDRFQEAIDAAAMGARLFGTDGYLEQWRRVSRQVDGEPADEVAAEVARLETKYDDHTLARLVRQRGLEETP